MSQTQETASTANQSNPNANPANNGTYVIESGKTDGKKTGAPSVTSDQKQ